MSIPSFKLNTGAFIPAVGLGTWQSKPGEVEKAVEHALRSGYRHLDCAFCYGNEKEVGKGIKASGVKREDIFITSKIWCTYHTRVEEGFNKSLSDLGVDYLDLLLVHWPVALNPNGNDPMFPKLADGTRDVIRSHDPNTNTWKAMEMIYKSGKAKAIGVSNWSIPNLEALLASAEIVPAANQVELHPYLPQDDLLKFCNSKGIIMEAYSPLGSTNSPLLTDPDITKIAEKHGTETGNVLISYQVKRGVAVLPKSVTPARIEKNLKLVPLDGTDMAILNSLHKTKGMRFIKPDWNTDLKFPDWN